MKTQPCTLIAILLITLYPLSAQQTLPTKQVSIFKNGSCMFTKEGTLRLKDNVLRLPVPNAINSTYWIGTPGDKLIKMITYKNEKIKVKQEAASVLDVIEMNIGKNIQFEIVRNEQRQTQNGTSVLPTYIMHTGKILGVNKKLNAVNIAEKSGAKLYSVDDIHIGNFSIEDAADYKSVDSTVRYAIITPTKPVSELTVQEISLQNGVQWIPAYSLKLINEKEARIEMKALLENYSNEDIANADADVIVGIPQLYYSNLLDPSTSSAYTTNPFNVFNNVSGLVVRGSRNTDNKYLLDGQDVSDVVTGRLGSAASSAGAQYAPTASSFASEDVQIITGNSSATYGNAIGGVVNSVISTGTSDAPYVVSNVSYEADAEQSKDIFVYKLGNITIDKNTKASFPVFATSIEYKDIHECEIPDFTSHTFYRKTVIDNMYDVFHSIELHNTTSYPLTTAGVIVTDDKNRFLAQDELRYVPKNDKGKIRLAKAINARVRCTEEETERNEDDTKIAKVYYHMIHYKGKLLVTNFSDKEVTIKLTKKINGTVTDEGIGKVRKTSEVYTVNPQSEIRWEVTLKSGEKQELKYEYESLFHP
ncbi:MAG: TonB-dependent receptor plug domain-containing protein [Candidatus Kapaibacterium sp.]